MNRNHILCSALAATMLFACENKRPVQETEKIPNAANLPADTTATTDTVQTATIAERVKQYAPVRLTADLSKLTAKEKQMIPLLLDCAKIMDDIFKQQTYTNYDSLVNATADADLKRYIEMNYGPWDRLNEDKPFVPGVGEKPEGANFYPANMTKAEFESANLADKASQYTLLRRDSKGKLITVPYRTAYATQLKKASDLLKKAAALAEDKGLKNYLTLRADALLTDKYQPSDLAWMDMKTNTLDFVVGPIEVYEDKLFGYKAAHEAYILVKDKDWSKKLEKYAATLPELQKGLPVPAKYKAEKPGTDADLNAYDVLYYAGHANTGGKTIAINLPNDEEVQLKKGARRLQLKNAMRAKFDKILMPIGNMLIAEDQRKHLTFDAFFATTMFHEVAHGLGIKKTVNGKGLVREALKEQGSGIEEGKADILGLYMITQLHKKGMIEGDLKDYYTTFLASVIRSVRFGAGEAHGAANMVRFNYFAEQGAFQRDAKTGTYRVDYAKMETAMNKLSEILLTLQGNGDYEGVKKLFSEEGRVGADLQKDLDRLQKANIPVDVTFEQGKEVLGL
ncbi:dipeptidyl-peptidase 3 family protein [Adhaeribacter terreus]|uniref:Zn-dependent hydrolase n=1 Tax=Adhaeribacter terreus TaxID=529703 RepID=A0ABW0EFW1_9BACT